jgi:hypothetical protein
LNPDPDELPKILAKIKDGLPNEKQPTAADSNVPAPAADAPLKKDGG